MWKAKGVRTGIASDIAGLEQVVENKMTALGQDFDAVKKTSQS
jgi:hypothetical protein